MRVSHILCWATGILVLAGCLIVLPFLFLSGEFQPQANAAPPPLKRSVRTLSHLPLAEEGAGLTPAPARNKELSTRDAKPELGDERSAPGKQSKSENDYAKIGRNVLDKNEPTADFLELLRSDDAQVRIEAIMGLSRAAVERIAGAQPNATDWVKTDLADFCRQFTGNDLTDMVAAIAETVVYNTEHGGACDAILLILAMGEDAAPVLPQLAYMAENHPMEGMRVNALNLAFVVAPHAAQTQETVIHRLFDPESAVRRQALVIGAARAYMTVTGGSLDGGRVSVNAQPLEEKRMAAKR